LDCDEEVNTFEAVWKDFGPPQDALPTTARKRSNSNKSKSSQSADSWQHIWKTMQDIGISLVLTTVVLLCFRGFGNVDEDPPNAQRASSRNRPATRASRGVQPQPATPAGRTAADQPRGFVSVVAAWCDRSVLWFLITRLAISAALWFPCVIEPVHLAFYDDDNPNMLKNRKRLGNFTARLFGYGVSELNEHDWQLASLEMSKLFGLFVCCAWATAPLAPFRYAFALLKQLNVLMFDGGAAPTVDATAQSADTGRRLASRTRASRRAQPATAASRTAPDQSRGIWASVSAGVKWCADIVLRIVCSRVAVAFALWIPCVVFPLGFSFLDPGNPSYEDNRKWLAQVAAGLYGGDVEHATSMAVDLTLFTGLVLCFAWAGAPLTPFWSVLALLKRLFALLYYMVSTPAGAEQPRGTRGYAFAAAAWCKKGVWWLLSSRLAIAAALWVPCVLLPVSFMLFDPSNPSREDNWHLLGQLTAGLFGVDAADSFWVVSSSLWFGLFVCFAWAGAPLAPFRSVFALLKRLYVLLYDVTATFAGAGMRLAKEIGDVLDQHAAACGDMI
jgi:hypothetical protein